MIFCDKKQKPNPKHFTAFITTMCCEPKLVSHAIKSSRVKSRELTKDFWRKRPHQLRATVQLHDQDYHNRIKK